MLQGESTQNDLLIYASVDVNGLKVINDSLGHIAGDELICGAADCLKQVFGTYGKVFRIGGDEYAVIFFADDEKFSALKDELDLSMVKYISDRIGVLHLGHLVETGSTEDREGFYL